MIRKFLDISTAHVSPAARGWLDTMGEQEADRTGDGGAHNVAITRHGWFVYAPGPESGETALHEDLKSVATYAREQGCDYILFDADADVVDGLPAFQR